jgi:PKHD-type hydroxylase
MMDLNNAAWKLYTDHVHRYAYVDNVFTNEECDRIIDFAKKFKMKQALIYNDAGDGIENNLESRKSNILFLPPVDETIWMFQRITDAVLLLNEHYFKFDLHGFDEGFQFTEYTAPGGHYTWHVDKIANGIIRKLSIVVQLTDENEYVGGDFEINDGKQESLSRKRGTVLAFPSYTLHRVSPVTQGTRHSLVSWISGKPFK